MAFSGPGGGLDVVLRKAASAFKNAPKSLPLFSLMPSVAGDDIRMLLTAVGGLGIASVATPGSENGCGDVASMREALSASWSPSGARACRWPFAWRR